MRDLVKKIRVMCDWNLPLPPPPLPFSSHIWFSYIYSHLFTLIFHVCLISPISDWHVTRLSRHSVMLMNEGQSLHHFESKVVSRNFPGLWQLTTLKDLCRSKIETFKISLKRKKTKTWKEKQKVTWIWRWHFSRLRAKNCFFIVYW